MKQLLLASLLAALWASGTRAADGPVIVTNSTVVAGRFPSKWAADAAADGKWALFDLDFPGGTVQQFADTLHTQNPWPWFKRPQVQESIRETQISAIRAANFALGDLRLYPFAPNVLLSGEGGADFVVRVGAVQAYSVRGIVSDSIRLEDIIAALELAAEMTGSPLEIKYHEATQLLLVAGPQNGPFMVFEELRK